MNKGSVILSAPTLIIQCYANYYGLARLDKAPRLSIRRVIWILASDIVSNTVFVQLNQ